MSERVVAIHQPNYLPWIGYFHKIYESDVFIYLDDVEYTSGSWINRNKLKTPNGWMWLSVPVASSTDEIRETEIATYEEWRSDHRRTFQQNYGGTDHYDTFEELLERTYRRSWKHLVDLNVFLVESLCDMFDLETDFRYASDLSGGDGGAKHLAELANDVGADTYLSGSGADGYMDLNPFDSADINVRLQSINPPEYPQRFDGFEPNLSAIDVAMNVGTEQTHEIITSL